MAGKWVAKGLLKPLWRNYPGGRDALAAAVGTTASTLSSINTGNRGLGQDLGGRLAAELGVSVLELGAPEEEADDEGLTLRGRLEEAEALLNRLVPQVDLLAERVVALEKREPSRQRRGGHSQA